MEGKCYCYGKAGHKSPSCPKKNKPKAEWAINKLQQSHTQAQYASNTSTVTAATSASVSNSVTPPSTDTGVATGWSGAQIHCQFYQAHEMKDWILLDNQSTATIFCNKDLVTNIQEISETMDLYTNANKKATIPQWGDAWFNADAITNIFSAAEMAEKYRVTYNSTIGDAYIVYLPNKTVRFVRTPTGLYIFKPPIKKT